MTGLANELGVTISDDPRLGDRYDAGAFEYRSLSDFLYLPLINKETD